MAPLVVASWCAEAKANPIALALPARDRLYLASEHLRATVSSESAEVTGTFTFQYRQDAPAPGRKSFVMLEIPIWFPETHPRDPSVARFWRAFPRDEVAAVSRETREVFAEALGLQVLLGDQPLPVEQFSTLTSTNTKWRWAPREWREAGFCCLIFRFYVRDDSTLVREPLRLSYREPLLEAGGAGRFFYLPVFQNLPAGASTTDTNRYSITVAAHLGCSLTGSSGDRNFAVAAGRSITLGPRHHQALRVTATSRPAKVRGTSHRPSSPFNAAQRSATAGVTPAAWPSLAACADPFTKP